MYIFGMFYCGTIKVGCGPITQIIGGSNGSLWIMWDHDNCINISKAACPLFEKNTAFSKVLCILISLTYYIDNHDYKRQILLFKISYGTQQFSVREIILYQ